MDKAKRDFITNCLMAGKDDWYANERQGCLVVGRNDRSYWAVKFDGHLAHIMNMDDSIEDPRFVTVDWELLMQRNFAYAS